MKKFFYIILAISIIYGGYYYFFKNSSSKTKISITYETVQTGSIKESIDVVGSAELVNEQSIRFNKLGTITKVNFKDGDKIKKGQIIAEIDKSVGQTSIKEAQLNLDNAKLNLTQLYDKADKSKIMQAQNNITNTQNSLNISKKELDNLKNTQTNSINDLSKNIELAKKELDNLGNTQTNSLNDLLKNIANAKTDIDISKSSLELAKANLEVTKNKLNNDLSNTVSNKSNSISQIETSFAIEKSNIAKIIDEIDIVLGVSDKNKTLNDNYESYLGAKNSNLKPQAIAYLGEAINSYNKLSLDISNYDNSGDISKLKIVLNSVLNTYKSLEKATDLTYQTIDNSISSINFSQNSIDSMKSSMYNYKTNVQSKISSVNNTINSLNTLTNTDLLSQTNSNTISQKQDSINSSILNITKKENDLKTLQNNYETTKTSYDIAYKNKEQSLTTLQNNYNTTKAKNEIDLNSKLQSIENTTTLLEINNQALKELIEGPTTENVAKAKNSITQTEIKLKDANDGLKDYELESPFDGIVRKIDYKVGDKLLSDSDKYVYIENPNLVQIPVSLDQIDIVKVQIGKKATITFDAYPTIKVEGTINSIDYTPVKTSGVVSYTAYLIITDKKFDKKILSGMTADIEIITEQKENVLLLPTTAITTQDNKSYVKISKNGKNVKTEIQTGLSAGGKTEIVSGLEAGDQVGITSFSGTTSKASGGLFSIPTNRNRTSNSSSSAGGPPGGF